MWLTQSLAGVIGSTIAAVAEADFWKMSDRINWVLSVCDDKFDLQGVRIQVTYKKLAVGCPGGQ